MKILYVTTILNTVNAFLIPHIKMLIEQGHKVDVASNVDQADSTKLIELGCEIYDVPFQRSPIKKDNINAYKLIKKILLTKKYDVVHTHTPIASTITRLACKNIKNTKIYYTAHGFHFYKGASISNWLIYYPIEKYLSKFTDTLITINTEDYEIAKSNFKAKRVVYMSGVGINIDKFKNIVVDKVGKRQELGIPHDSSVVLSVGELNKNKNHDVIIRAIAKINNPNIHYVICGKGPVEGYLKNLCKELKIEGNVHLLGYRKDVAEIYKISDIFVFPSYREGLPVSLMEAMASGLPIVCSNIRGNTDLIENGKGGFLVSPSDPDNFAEYINELILNSKLRDKFIKFNLNKIEKYSLYNVTRELKHIYGEILGDCIYN